MLMDRSKLEAWICTLEVCQIKLPPGLDPVHPQRLAEMINYFYVKLRHGEEKF